jgi:TetR/AcrR family transcriptional repressor of nem operon
LFKPTSLEHENRICLCSFMGAEYDDLPAAVHDAVQVFANQNVAWLGQVLEPGGLAPAAAQLRARNAPGASAALHARGRQ